jgi:hypothetical protein
MKLDFKSYIKHMKDSKEVMPSELYNFASNPKHYELNDAQSLHDAWVSSIVIEEMRDTNRPFNASLKICIKLLGQQHDRSLTLNYLDVKSYAFSGNKNELNPNDTFHGDILDHRVAVNSDSFGHTLHARSGSAFKVVFGRFSYHEQRNT